MRKLICNYIQSSYCNSCEYQTKTPLNNPICMSCRYVNVIGKKDNYKKRDLSLHRKTSCREKENVN